MDKLPNEILMEIFNHLYDINESLFKCVMTSWIWANIAIPILWQDPFKKYKNEVNIKEREIRKSELEIMKIKYNLKISYRNISVDTVFGNNFIDISYHDIKFEIYYHRDGKYIDIEYGDYPFYSYF
ncbi:4363_t:CDS:2 [Scutellospora calospora]|uniref:4363_t:CDS:1 n=1 Tax=Scutellospora calospora TaxID=85575 RepID=A0ACA9JZ95_9GLOM|nr:4363_t:CDS:2 [Scutellospora calospora]